VASVCNPETLRSDICIRFCNKNKTSSGLNFTTFSTENDLKQLKDHENLML
jgi:hypothetical protein